MNSNELLPSAQIKEKSALQNPMQYAIMFAVMIGDGGGIRGVTAIVHGCAEECGHKERT